MNPLIELLCCSTEQRTEPDVEELDAKLEMPLEHCWRRQGARNATCGAYLAECVFERRHYVRMVDAARVSQRLCQITWRHKEHVHVFNAQDIGEVVERLHLLQHHRDQRLRVGALRILRHVLTKDRPPATPAAMTERRKLGMLHRGKRFGRRIDVR